MFVRKHAQNTEGQRHLIRQQVQNTLLTGTDRLYISQLRLVLEKSLHGRRENSTGMSVSESTNNAIFSVDTMAKHDGYKSYRWR